MTYIAGQYRARLAESLLEQSATVRERIRERLPTAAELDTITLLEGLAEDAAYVSEHVLLLFRMMLLIDDRAEAFGKIARNLFERIGADFVPRDAADLVRWLMIETLHRDGGSQEQCEAPVPKPPAAAAAE